jgi:hypothetical protein
VGLLSSVRKPYISTKALILNSQLGNVKDTLPNETKTDINIYL